MAIEPVVVTDAMVTAAIQAFGPFLDEEGHLTCLNAREAVEACLRAALQVQTAADLLISKARG